MDTLREEILIERNKGECYCQMGLEDVTFVANQHEDYRDEINFEKFISAKYTFAVNADELFSGEITDLNLFTEDEKKEIAETIELFYREQLEEDWERRFDI